MHPELPPIPVGPLLTSTLELLYRARKGAFLVGPHGIGKSQMFKHLSTWLGLAEPIIRDLSIMEPTDLVGLPRFDGGTTRFAEPSWLPADGAGIFVLEELTRAPIHMQAPVFQLMTERRLNDYRLPDDWVVMASMNPADSEYLVRELDPALMSRFCVIPVRADQESWVAWAAENGVHPKVIALAQANPDIFEENLTNPRSLTSASDLLKAAEAVGKFDAQTLLAAVAGFIGEALAQEIVERPNFAKRSIQPQEILTALDSVRATLTRWQRERRLDHFEKTASDMSLYINRKFGADARNLPAPMQRNFQEFLRYLPPDVAAQIRETCMS